MNQNLHFTPISDWTEKDQNKRRDKLKKRDKLMGKSLITKRSNAFLTWSKDQN